jgi:uncharacterized protein YfbU (UPF0304 family)
MKQIQFIQVSPEELQEAIITGVNIKLEELKKGFEPKSPTEYLTRIQVAEMFKINISSVHNWTKKSIIIAYQIGGRVYYKRSEIETAIIELKTNK